MLLACPTNRSIFIFDGNPTGTGRVLIEHPQWPSALSLSTAKAHFSQPGTISALTRTSTKSVVLSLVQIQMRWLS